MRPNDSKFDGGDRILESQPAWTDMLVAHFADYHDAASHHQSRASLEETQRLVDRDLETLVSLMASFRFQRNHLCLVNRLPPEVLARISMSTLTIPTPPFGPATKLDIFPPSRRLPPTSAGPGHPSPFSFTYVCLHWRNVALGSPSLWANITPEFGSEWTRTMLSRAKSASLLVARSFRRDEEISDLAESAKSCGPQFQHLALASYTGKLGVQPAIARLLQGPAPILESLLLVQANVGRPEYDDGEGTEYRRALAYTMPANLFDGYCPVLQQISLRGLMLPWTSTLWSNRITHAEISPYYYPEPVFGSSIGQLLQCLQRMPALELLTLRMCLSFGPQSSQSLENRPIVDIPLLRSLTLEDEVSRCTYLMDRLHLPCLEKLDLSLQFGSKDGFSSESCDAIVPALTNLVGQIFADRPVTMAGFSEEHATVAIEAWCSNAGVKADRTDWPEPLLTIRFAIAHDERGVDPAIRYLKRLCRILPLHDLEDLCMRLAGRQLNAHAGQVQPHSVWPDVVGECSHARRLFLDITTPFQALSDILGLLAMDTVGREAANATAGTARLGFPHLQELGIMSRLCPARYRPDRRKLVALASLLVSVLSARRTLGAPVHTLRVEIPGLGGSDAFFRALEVLSSDGVVSVAEFCGA